MPAIFSFMPPTVPCADAAAAGAADRHAGHNDDPCGICVPHELQKAIFPPIVEFCARSGDSTTAPHGRAEGNRTDCPQQTEPYTRVSVRRDPFAVRPNRQSREV